MTESWSHLGLQVSLLYRVARDLAVAVVLGRLPLQGDIEAPDLCDGDLDRRPRLVCEQRVGIEVQQEVAASFSSMTTGSNSLLLRARHDQSK